MNDKTKAIATKGVMLGRLALKFGVSEGELFHALKVTAFKQAGGDDQQPSDAEMLALLVVADQYGLNPFTRQIFAFLDKHRGIVPVVGVDGWSAIINGHDHFDGMEFTEAKNKLKIDDHHKKCPAWIECVIYHKKRDKPIRIREYLDECYKGPKVYDGGSVSLGPWQTHTKRQLRHKSIVQCARIAFGFTGIHDEDEARDIIDAEAVRIIEPEKVSTVTPEPKSRTESVAAKLKAKTTEPPSEESAKAAKEFGLPDDYGEEPGEETVET
jgi:phage recombination protein Bet